MLSTRPASDITVHVCGLRISSTYKRFPQKSFKKDEREFIPSNEFVGAEMPLPRAMRQLATDKALGVNQSVIFNVC